MLPATRATVSVLGRSGELNENFIEAIAFSPSRGAYVFCTIENGQWTLVGDGRQIVPARPRFVSLRRLSHDRCLELQGARRTVEQLE